MTDRNSFSPEMWEALENGDPVTFDLQTLMDMAALGVGADGEADDANLRKSGPHNPEEEA